MPFKIGAQDVSQFENGAYTGEVSAMMLAEYAQYVLVGHSERRKYFHEDEDILKRKTEVAKKHGLIPVYCITGENEVIPQGISITAYEPVWAIGSGQADNPENASYIARTIRKKYSIESVLYGGSVNVKNVQGFINHNGISGVLIGGASLAPDQFSDMIINVAKA